MDPRTDEKVAQAIASPASFDELDPHGEHQHHGHVIMRLSTLVGVLLVLLILTAVTVGLAVGERVVSDALGVPIPNWLNVALVMSIAIVKGVLVALYFMQLRYDNPINGIIFAVCLAIALLFIVPTAIDLRTRDLVYPFKAGEIVKGGTQNFGSAIAGDEDVGLARTNVPIYQWARERAVLEWGPERFAEEEAKAHGGHHDDVTLPTAKRSVPRKGLSGALDGPAPSGHAEPAGAH